MSIHPCVDKIKDLLVENGMWYDYFEHEPVRTSEEAAKIRPERYTLKQGTKALIIRVKSKGAGKKHVMVIVPGDRKFDAEKVKKVLDAKDIRFAFEEEVSTITKGIAPGGVPPFGNLFGLEVYVSDEVLENDKIIFNAGDKKVSIGMCTSDYLKLVNPKVASIT